MSETKVLQGWKEIARYMNRGVRTVQRWEAMFGLPVHRPAGRPRSAVLARVEEVEDWLSGTPLLKENGDGIPTRQQLLAEVLRLRGQLEYRDTAGKPPMDTRQMAKPESAHSETWCVAGSSHLENDPGRTIALADSSQLARGTGTTVRFGRRGPRVKILWVPT
jgi:hypothetical protein